MCGLSWYPLHLPYALSYRPQKLSTWTIAPHACCFNAHLCECEFCTLACAAFHMKSTSQHCLGSPAGWLHPFENINAPWCNPCLPLVFKNHRHLYEFTWNQTKGTLKDPLIVIAKKNTWKPAARGQYERWFPGPNWTRWWLIWPIWFCSRREPWVVLEALPLKPSIFIFGQPSFLALQLYTYPSEFLQLS